MEYLNTTEIKGECSMNKVSIYCMEDLDVGQLAIALEDMTKEVPNAKFISSTEESVWLLAYSPEAPMNGDIADKLVKIAGIMSSYHTDDELYTDYLEENYELSGVRMATVVSEDDGIYNVWLEDGQDGIDYQIIWR